MTNRRTVTFNAGQADELAEVLRGLLLWIAFGSRRARADLARSLRCDAHPRGPLDTPDPLATFTALVDAYHAILDPEPVDTDAHGT